MVSRIRIDLSDFGFCNIMSIDPAYAFPTRVNVQHDLGRPFPAHPEEVFQDLNDKLHWSIVIIQQNDFVHAWPLEFRLRLFNNKTVILIRRARLSRCHRFRWLKIAVPFWTQESVTPKGLTPTA